MAAPGGVEVGRVSVRVLPDTSRLGQDLKFALDRIEAQTELRVNATIDNARLDEEARAAVAQAELAAGNIHIKTEVDTSQAREAESVFASAASAAKGFSGGLGLVATAAIALGPALVPLIAVLGAIGGALLAPLAIAGGGFTLFAFLTGAVIKTTETQKKQIDALKKSVDSARQSLANTQASAAASAAASTATAQAAAQASLKSARAALAQATTASGRASAIARIHAAETALQTRKTAIATSQNNAVAAAQLRVNEALDKYHAALKALTPAQVKFLAAQAKVKAAFHNLIVTTGPVLLGPVTKVLDVVASIIPTLKPILTVVSQVVSDIIDQFANFAKSPGFSHFIAVFAVQLNFALREFAQIGGNVLTGLIGLFGSLGNALTSSVLTGLVLATRQFARWGQTVGQSKGFKAFIDYVKQSGPKVSAALSAIAGALANIVKAAAPIGTVVLVAITAIADAFQKIPVPVLTEIIAAMAALAVASKLAGPVSLIMEALAAPEIAITVIAVAALALGFVALYRSSKPLRQIIGDLVDFFTRELLPKIKDAASNVLPQLRKAFGDIGDAIKRNKPFLEVIGKLILVFGSAAVIGGIYALIGVIRVLGKYLAFQMDEWHFLADAILTALRVAVAGVTLFVKGVIFAFGTIVDAAAAAFGWLPGIGPKVKAAQAKFHEFADNVVNDLAKTSAALKAIQDQIDGLHDKKVTITVNTIERAQGQGGGAGRHAPNDGTDGTGVGSPRTSSGSSKSGPLVNIQNATFTSTDDVLRKGQRVYRSRAGGGVVIVGGNG